MRWQDLVFTLGSIVLLIAVIPMIMAKDKPPLSASVPAALILWVFAFTYFTLHFILTPIIEVIQGSLWAVLVWQKVQR